MIYINRQRRERKVREDILNDLEKWCQDVVPSGDNEIVIYVTVEGDVRSYRLTITERNQ